MSHDAYTVGHTAGQATRKVFDRIKSLSKEAQKVVSRNKYRSIALALLLAPVALEAGGALSREVNIEEEYAQRLREARQEWNARHRDNSTFQEYLHREGILSPERVEAIERIMAQYESPVRIRSGFSVVRTLIDVFENFEADGFYYSVMTPRGKEHVLFSQGELEFNSHFEEFVLSELAHVEQSERGELNAGSYIMDWIRYFGRRDAMYTTPDNPEGKAHGPGGYEERLDRDFVMIRDDYRLWARTALQGYLDNNLVTMFNPVQHSRQVGSEVPLFDESSLSYRDFVRFLTRLEEASRSHNTYDAIAGAQSFLRILENLPAFDAEEIERPDRSHSLRIIPSRELYEQFLHYLGPYTDPGVPPYAMERPSAHEHETLMQYMEYVDAAQDFDMTSLSTYRYFMVTLADSKDLDRALNNAHQGAYQALISRQEYDFERGVQERQRAGEAILTFPMYQRLAARLVEYAQTHETEREEGEGDPFLNLLYIFNNVCVYTPDCSPGSGIMTNDAGDVVARISTNEQGDHYRAFAKIFEDSRLINRSW